MFDCELVGKIGSMALIRADEYDIDYNVFSRICSELVPGVIWISSGAVEIGRLDYIKRNSSYGLNIYDVDNASYASQGQSIMMENYRRFINPLYSVRQVLVEHQHFNVPEKRNFIKKLLQNCVKHNAVPIINYNDSVSNEETRNLELYNLRKINNKVVECIDNDETASEISSLMKAKYLLLLTSSEGLFSDPNNPDSLIKEVIGKDVYELLENIDQLKKCCIDSSRNGSNGMIAKLSYISESIKNGTTVIIGNPKYRIKELLTGNVNRTIFRIN